MQTLIPLWGDGGRLHRALPFQHVSLSADQGILAQLEWKYMQGKGVFSLILWGRGLLNSLTLILPNDGSVRRVSFLKRISGMFREYIVLQEGLRFV